MNMYTHLHLSVYIQYIIHSNKAKLPYQSPRELAVFAGHGQGAANC